MNPQPLELVIPDINIGNYREKITKAIRTVSQYLNVPMTARKVEHTREPYFYDVQQELSDQWTGCYSVILKQIYDVLAAALELPRTEVETMRKSIDDGLLRYKGWLGKILSIFGYKGRIVYNPETGQPISKKDFDDLIEAIQRFLNRNTKDIANRLVLDSVATGKLLRRLAKYQSSSDMKRLKLNNLKYRGKTFDWIRGDIKNITNALGAPLSGSEMARYQVAQDYVAHLVTRSNQRIRDEIKDAVLMGIIEKRTKGQVSQDLFNRLGGLNRDWKRIADTEIVNTSNLAYILQEVNDAPKGEKVYFKRYELPGCCSKCAKVNGVIALWSNTPLADDKIKDQYASVAIWGGKPQEKGKTVLVTGTLHPNCRGGWLRWGGPQVDAMTAQVRGKTEKWDAAIKQAREEYQRKGTENPNDQTHGYIDRINELYREKLGKG
jgi:hypothetical protein